MKTPSEQQHAPTAQKLTSNGGAASIELMTTPLMQRRQQQQRRLVNPKQQRVNRTGLPYDLKTGMENLSGYDLDNVRVHYNSTKPTAVGAEAYTQGYDIHLASGQQKHLPHELGHVVQQMRGQVQANSTVRGMALNDNSVLEEEASWMGNVALRSCTKNDVKGKKSSPTLTPLTECNPLNNGATWEGRARRNLIMPLHRHTTGLIPTEPEALQPTTSVGRTIQRQVKILDQNDIDYSDLDKLPNNELNVIMWEIQKSDTCYVYETWKAFIEYEQKTKYQIGLLKDIGNVGKSILMACQKLISARRARERNANTETNTSVTLNQDSTEPKPIGPNVTVQTVDIMIDKSSSNTSSDESTEKQPTPTNNSNIDAVIKLNTDSAYKHLSESSGYKEDSDNSEYSEDSEESKHENINIHPKKITKSYKGNNPTNQRESSYIDNPTHTKKQINKHKMKWPPLGSSFINLNYQVNANRTNDIKEGVNINKNTAKKSCLNKLCRSVMMGEYDTDREVEKMVDAIEPKTTIEKRNAKAVKYAKRKCVKLAKFVNKTLFPNSPLIWITLIILVLLYYVTTMTSVDDSINN